MAKVELRELRHSYLDRPQAEDDWALKRIDLAWSDGGAYALLGPSGCGKTTLLNIISGLVTPTQGRVLFDGTDVTDLPPDRRNIAQVFQFPVIYDTMTVYQNLAFPLRNRGIGAAHVDARVREIAAMLELDDMLDRRAAGLGADNKQKISMGRGLVRDEVNVIMFDEPLTVIDPHLKWKLRSKLKELHQKVRLTMIYVTHDQTEALTFADRVVVMEEGEIVQIGTPVELFERPQHTFVGHFIGSPGMNVLPATVRDGGVWFRDTPVEVDGQVVDGGRLEIGVRPEFVRIAEHGVPVEIGKISDAGRHRVVEGWAGDHRVFFFASDAEEVPQGRAHLAFDPAMTRLYADGWLAGSQRHGETPAPAGVMAE
jgi:glycerol transport system ATP-binding protein